MSLTTHSPPGFAGDLNGGVLDVLGGSDGSLNGGVLFVLGGGDGTLDGGVLLVLSGSGVVGVNFGGGVGLGFGGLTVDPVAAWDNSYTNLLYLNVNLLLPSTLITSCS